MPMLRSALSVTHLHGSYLPLNSKPVEPFVPMFSGIVVFTLSAKVLMRSTTSVV
ncbi:MAG: hypothetical protein IPL86_16840 [Flavobacteriales bacterium]|nr:hypothetical protein [Flavobacteriales bacterium]